MNRHIHPHNHSQTIPPKGRPVSSIDEAHANHCFEHFLTASTLKTILGHYRNICEYLHLKPNAIPHFYPKLKSHIVTWKAKPLWKKFDARANQKCYGRGRLCPNTRVLIIGAGPCGLRTAIEAQLLGAKVVVVEKRDRLSRNNVLHLWPFVIDDLRALGAKKFFGKFCAGAIDHISIRQLQCILLKVALLLGVEIHTEVSFEKLIEPHLEEKTGWRAEFKPSDHPVSQFEFDVIIGADGKRNTLQGFKRKEFRGKLAIAITANFINKRTEAEARVEEISGVAFIFNQKFFKDLYAETGIDLENIVYYKDDTHYFVMTAKKQSLIEKGVIKQDLSDTERLLAQDNVDREELMNYAREAADFSTNYQMPDLEFAVNHYGQPDVAMFDFTSMYAAENASRMIEKHGYKLLSILVGDSLLEPFWPTGSGCARGFLSSMDAVWAIKGLGSGNMTPLEVIAERESIYRLLAQTTPENLNKDYKSYTLDPSTRYPNLNKNVLLPHQVTNLYDTDDPKSIELKPRSAPTIAEVPKKRRRRESHVDPETLLSWITDQLRDYHDLEVNNVTASFKDGRVFCAILHHYRPDLLDYSAISSQDTAKNNQLAFDLLEKELGIPPVMTGEEMANTDIPDYLTMVSYLTQIYDTFRCEIPHIKHPKLIEEKEVFLPKTSTAILFPTESTNALKPTLLTPRSSAKISDDDGKCSKSVICSSSESYGGSSKVTEMGEAKSREINSKPKQEKDLILIPIKSIENYWSKDDIPKEAINVGKAVFEIKKGEKKSGMKRSTSNIEIKRTDSSRNEDDKKSCIQTKSDPIFSKTKSATSKISTKNKKAPSLKRHSTNFVTLKIASERKTLRKRPVKSDITKTVLSVDKTNILPQKIAEDVFLERNKLKCKSSKSIIDLSHSSDHSSPQMHALNSRSEVNTLIDGSAFVTDLFRIINGSDSLGMTTGHDFVYESKKYLPKQASKHTEISKTSDEDVIFQILKPVESNLTSLTASNTEPLKSTIYSSTTNDTRKTEESNTCSNIPSRTEIAMDFLKEMEQFLHMQSVASQKIQEQKVEDQKYKPKNVIRRKNLAIDVCPKNNKDDEQFTTDMPKFLLQGKFNKQKDQSPDVIIKNFERKDSNTFAVQEVKFSSLKNYLTIVSRIISKVKPSLSFFSKSNPVSLDQTKQNVKCQKKFFKSLDDNKFSSLNRMSSTSKIVPPEAFARVEGWIISSPFEDESVTSSHKKDAKAECASEDAQTDITSITKQMEIQRKLELKSAHMKFINEELDEKLNSIEGLPKSLPLTQISSVNSHDSVESISKLMETLKSSQFMKGVAKITGFSPWELYEGRAKSKSEPPDQFSTIVEGEETEFPETKRSETATNVETIPLPTTDAIGALLTARPSSRHKRHVDTSIAAKQNIGGAAQDRKIRKRKTLEKVGASVDKDNRLPIQTKRETDEDFAARIKDLEDKWREPIIAEKKPKDLMRAIGKIETSDWNIKEIEKKIIENKLGKTVNKDKEKVPKWSREQFLARQNKMERQHLERQDSTGGKFSEIDKNIKQLEHKLKEGTTRDLNQQKVASITEKLVGKAVEPPQPPQPKPVQRSNSRTILGNQGSEYCHFCSKRVYLMERLSAEGKFFHRGCFRCQYCHTLLRLGSYTFDREGLYGSRFYCTQHFGMVGEVQATKVDKPALEKQPRSSPEKKMLRGAVGVDLLDRVQTPERIEFSNLSTGHVSSDHDESPSPIDEDEWTDRNFRNSVIDTDSSDDDSSSTSGSESDDEAFEEALEEPVTKEGTMRWVERYRKKYSRKHVDDSDSDQYTSSDHSSYYENSSGEDESDTATEGEEEIRQRELRKQEVRVEPPVTDTGTDTEIATDESSSESSSEILNSATEISTDSEFAHDDPTPTRDTHPMKLFDEFVTKTRGGYGQPKKVQVKSGILQQPVNGRTQNKNIELKFTPLVPSPVVRKPAPTSLFARHEGYALNRTQSTGGIATKVSLELKKKYLLGETNPSGSIQKSGSASTLDSKFKSFHTNISDCQKLLKPAPEISASMQVFCNKLTERTSPLSPTFGSPLLFNNDKPSAGLDLNLSSSKVDVSVTQKEELPKPDVTKCASESSVPEVIENKVINETEGRPRSPVHEKYIVVPVIDWGKNKQKKAKEKFVDSLSSSDTDSDDEKDFEKSNNVNLFRNIPRLEFHDDAGEIVPDHEAEMALDSLNVDVDYEVQPSSITDPPKSITSEKKTLNQPKPLPNLENSILSEMHSALHTKANMDDKLSNIKESDNKSVNNSSGRSSPSIIDDLVTAALTETELSDWARDGAVSDDFEDVEYDLGHRKKSSCDRRKSKDSQQMKKMDHVKKATIAELDDLGHICGKEKHNKDVKNKNIITECVNSILYPNLDNIEFMDTGTETSSDDNIEVKNNGYVQFHNEEDFIEDSLSPQINVIEVINPTIKKPVEEFVDLSTSINNTGYCIIGDEKTKFEFKNSDCGKLKEKLGAGDNEDDSLIIIETGTTTEENTCSDSTVKNLAEKTPETPKDDKIKSPETKDAIEHLFKDRKRLEEKLVQVKQDMAKLNEQNGITKLNELKDNKAKEQVIEQIAEVKLLTDKSNKSVKEPNIEFEEHCQRLQSKIEFGNVKDSIDIRKSRRKSRTESIKPDLIQEEKEKLSPEKSVTKEVSPKLNKKEEIEKERHLNQRLVQEMVMNKMRAQNKSLERKKRNRNSFSPCRPFDLTKSATTDLATQITASQVQKLPPSQNSNLFPTPDVLLSVLPSPIQKSQTISSLATINNSIDLQEKTAELENRKLINTLSQVSNIGLNLPDVSKIGDEVFKTPKAPPRLKNEEAKRTAEKLKQDARARVRLLSDEDLGLGSEDQLIKLRQKTGRKKKENEKLDVHILDGIESLVINTERRNSLLYNNDTLKRNTSFRRSKSGDGKLNTQSNLDLSGKLSLAKSSQNIDPPVRTKSVSEIHRPLQISNSNRSHERSAVQICKSDPNLLMDGLDRKDKKRSKDRERRKSITKFLADIFTKKKESPNSSNKSFLARISPKSKNKSKSCVALDQNDIGKIIEESLLRRNSISEVNIRREFDGNVSPPPIPPLPENYTGTHLTKDESSDAENEFKALDRSSCDTLDQSGILDGSVSSVSGRRSCRSARKAERQAQLKRHRLAQEIQRKLEETEVKTRELENRGVTVEKALRGETNGASVDTNREESDLLREWFDLMRDRTELRRYERELMVRGQELELEDRHARLQHDLRERLENNEPKTKEEMKIEGSIIKEMMEIVAKRDSLIVLLEEDRIRYSEEDRGFEEQMLAKGIQLTPLAKTTEK